MRLLSDTFEEQSIFNVVVGPLGRGKSWKYIYMYMITQNLGNDVAHVHYHPCNEYQAVFFPPPPELKKQPGDEANTVCELL